MVPTGIASAIDLACGRGTKQSKRLSVRWCWKCHKTAFQNGWLSLYTPPSFDSDGPSITPFWTDTFQDTSQIVYNGPYTLLTLCLYASEIRSHFFFLKVIWVCQEWFVLPKCYFFLRSLECIVWGNKIFLQNKANEFHVTNHFQMLSLLHFSRPDDSLYTLVFS